MRVLAVALLAFLSALVAAPVASAVYQPPPICPACTVLVAIAYQCGNAIAQEQVNHQGDGCAIVNQQVQCVQDEAAQDVWVQGTGCNTVNNEQTNVGCEAWQVTNLLGIDSCHYGWMDDLIGPLRP